MASSRQKSCSAISPKRDAAGVRFADSPSVLFLQCFDEKTASLDGKKDSPFCLFLRNVFIFCGQF